MGNILRRGQEGARGAAHRCIYKLVIGKCVLCRRRVCPECVKHHEKGECRAGVRLKSS